MLENEVEQINQIDNDANIHTDAAVVTTDGDTKKVFDFLDFLENSSKENDSLKKIRNLRQYITDTELLVAYQNKFGTITTEDEVLDSLEEIFDTLANYITNLTNGIVINKNTGLKDEDESIKQSIEYGILSEDTIVESFDKTLKDTLEEIANIGRIDNEKVSYMLENFGSIIISYEEFNDDIDNFMNKKKEDTNLSEELKNVFEDSKDIIEQSPYETDMHLFEICNLYVKLNDAQKEHSQDYNLILSKIKDFYAKNPDYLEKDLPVLNKDGSLNEFEVKKMNEYSEAYQKLIILEHLDSFNGMSKQELENIKPSERKHMIMCAFAGLKYISDTRNDEREIAKESMRMIKGLYPELDLSNEQELVKFYEKISGVKTNFKSLNVQDLIEIYAFQLKDATDNYIEKDTESYIGKKIDFTNLDLDSSKRKFSKFAMKNYFVGSKIKFTGKDEDLYNMMYQEFTINSWIENKDDAIKLRYMALLDTLEKYKDMPPNEYISKKIYEIQNNISNFENKFGMIDVESQKDKLSFDMYRQYFINAGLAKYLTRDVYEWQDGTNYEDLDDTHKKGYIRNILVALEYKDNPDFCITKLALRRLELMNSDRKKFITFDENGGYKINEELILQEYNRMSDHTYADFEELTKSAELRKYEYLLTKLDEYTHLNDEDFLKLENKADKNKTMEQIEEKRRESNQQRIEERSSNQKKGKEIQDRRRTDSLNDIVRNCKNIIKRSPYETDMHLFEICKLYVDLNDAEKGHSQDYNLILSKIKDFYDKNPKYVGRKLPVLNEDRTLNKTEVNKMNEYSEAYQKIVILEHLDTFNGMTPQELGSMSDTEKKHMIMCAFAGLKYQNASKENEKNISRESMKAIKQLYPNLDLNNEQELAKIFKEMSGIDIKDERLSLNVIIEISSQQLRNSVENYIENDQESYIGKKIDFSTLDLDSNMKKIPDPPMEKIFERAEELDVSAIENINKTSNLREDKKGDQEEAGDNNTTTDTTGSEKKSAIEVGNINISTTQDKPPKFIDRIKIALKNIKDRIEKFIKGEEETFALDVPNDDNMTNELNDENNSTGYNINQKFNIDHNLANSGKNLSGKTQEDQEPEIGGIEG